MTWITTRYGALLRLRNPQSALSLSFQVVSVAIEDHTTTSWVRPLAALWCGFTCGSEVVGSGRVNVSSQVAPVRASVHDHTLVQAMPPEYPIIRGRAAVSRNGLHTRGMRNVPLTYRLLECSLDYL